MRKSAAAVVLVVFALVTMGQEGCETTTEDRPLEESPGQGANGQEAKARPDGAYDLACDYVLGDLNESEQGFRFVGGGTIRNKGNIGIRVRVTFRWQQLGSTALVERKTYRVPVGKTREVNVTRPATGDEIDLHQAADGKCSARATIVGRFGKVR